MSLGNTSSRYGAVAKSFHWLIALLILTAVPLGIMANDMAHALRDPAITNTQDDILRTVLLFSMHKTTGILIFFVALARILWALSQPKPAPLHPERRLETFAAETVHWLLYGSLLLVPLTGWIHHSATTGFAPIWWPFGQSLPFVPKDDDIAALFGGLHGLLEKVLVASVFLHVAGAVKHQVIDRDATLRRMLPGTPDLPTPAPHRASLAPALAALGVWAAALGIGAMLGLFSHTHGPSQDAAAPHDSTAQTADAPAYRIASDTSTDLPPSPGWQVDDGTLAISILQMGSAVTGQFADWTANITFDDPDAPGPAGHVDVTIDIGSLTLGSVTDQAMGADYFDVATFPTARFEADIVKTDTGYLASGPLTIRDVTIAASLPFALTLEGDTATMTGTLTLDRMDYGVGATTKDEGSLGFAVEVSVALTATRTGRAQ